MSKAKSDTWSMAGPKGTAWKFWAIITSEGTKGSAYQVEEIVKVTRLQQFFKYYDQIPKPSAFSAMNGKRVQLAFFKDNITPAWEAKNEKGEMINKGALGYVFPETEVDKIWELLLFMCVGNMFENPHAALNAEASGVIDDTSNENPPADSEGGSTPEVPEKKRISDWPKPLTVNGILIGRAGGRQIERKNMSSTEYTVEIWVGEHITEKDKSGQGEDPRLEEWNRYLSSVEVNGETIWKQVTKCKAKSFEKKRK